jgi:hypothetical protein
MKDNKTDTLSLRMPAEIKKLAQIQADKSTRTLVGQVVHYIKQGLIADGAINEQHGMGPRNSE